MKKFKRIIAVATVVIMTVAMLPVLQGASGKASASDVVYEVKTADELLKTIKKLNSEKCGGTIKLMADISVNGNYGFNNASDNTLDLNGMVLKCIAPALQIEGKTGLTLKDSNPNRSHEDSTLPVGGVVTGVKLSGSSSSTYGGGVNNRGTFIMNGGSIANSKADFGGGVYSGAGTFVMNGGSIANSKATFGGGVYSVGKFVLNKGKIIGNTSTQEGGGVWNSSTTAYFQMNGGSIIGNSGGTGAGVWNSRTFEMNGGDISNNTAGIDGGGVESLATFEMNGGSITGNTAARYGGGVVTCGSGETTRLKGSVNITGNTAGTAENKVTENVWVHTNAGSVLTIDNYLNSDAKIGITTSGEPSSGNNVKFAEGGLSDYSDQFISDKEGFTVLYSGSGNHVLAKGYKVRYNVQGHGVKPNNQIIQSGSKIDKPDDPVAEGYIFSGWFKESGCVDEWNFDEDVVTSDVTLYAKWVPKKSDPGSKDFEFSAPESLVYDGYEKVALVKTKPNITGMGDITKKYYDSEGKILTTSPLNAGTYKVKIDVTEGDEYNAAAGITDDSWTFTIDKAENTIKDLTCSDVAYGMTPTPSSTAEYGTPAYSYSTSEDGTFGEWNASNPVGTYYVKAKVEESLNYKEASDIESFKVKKSIGECSIDDIDNQSYTGSTITPEVTVKDGNKELTKDEDYKVSYDSNIDIGTATAIVTGEGNYSGKKSVSFKITKGIIENAIVEQSSYAYTGSPITPSVTVENSVGTVLEKDTDYVILYKNNTDVGTATITVTGKGNYEGEKTASFEITRSSIESVTPEKTSYEYSGSPIKPSVTVTNSAGTELKENTDYTVSYSNNTSVGEATITVTGKGNYTGEKTATFEIIRSSIGAIVLDKNSYEYTGSQITPAVKVTNSAGTELEKDTDYTVAYEDNVNVGTATITVTGKGNYTGESNVTFKITKKSIASATIENETYEYTGSAITPEVTAMDGNGKALVKDTDYTVAYTNNINEGTATITVTGIGNCQGTKTITFEIKKDLKEIGNAAITKTSYEYTGSAITPEVTVKDDSGENTLVKDTDYTVAYDNNTNAGTATITIKGIDKYTGNKTLQFTITKAKLTGASIPQTKYTYTGEAIKPVVTVTGVNDEILTKDKDYTVDYTDNVNVGKAIIVISGTGNYEGTKLLTFEIVEEKVAKKIESAKVAKATYTYTGGLLKPAVVVKAADGKTLTKGTDYSVAYSNNKNPGRAKVAVTGINDYEGSSKVISFKIIPKGTSITKAVGAKKAFTVKWKKQATQTTGYLVKYQLKGSSTIKTKTVKSNKTTKLTIKGLKTKKKYNVRVATYKTVGGTKYQSTWSKVKVVTTK